MKILLMALNSKFIHSNLAIRSIAAYYQEYYCHLDYMIEVKEYTINNEMDLILQDMVKGSYDGIFVSSYIWNIEALNVIFTNYRKIKSNSFVIFGGPEVSFDPKDQLKQHPYLNGIICGEGERIFSEFLLHLQNTCLEEAFRQTPGMAYRVGMDYFENPPMPLIDHLEEIPFPYSDMALYQNRIIYYESSRGCPYNCSYCLSSALKGVRHLSIERVKRDLKFFIDQKVPQVKFVDRTFNAVKSHALAIMNYLMEIDNGITNFHFEITASLLDEDYIQLIQKSRKGLFQFEVGIQTTNQMTLSEIHRPIQFDRVKEKCLQVIRTGNVHLHVDLIAGLPYENYTSFLNSFDDVYEIGAEQLQLGFLKILKGTAISREIEKHGYVVRVQAPYEVLYNKHISYDEMIQLKELERILEYYYNSGKFTHTLKFLMSYSQERPSQFYLKMCQYFRDQNLLNTSIGTYRLYEILYDYCSVTPPFNLIDQDVLRDFLKLDYYFSNLKGNKELFHYPEIPQFNNKRFELLKNKEFVDQYWTSQSDLSTKALVKNVEFITLKYDIINFIQSNYQHLEPSLSVVMLDYLESEQVKIYPIDLNYFIDHKEET